MAEGPQTWRISIARSLGLQTIGSDGKVGQLNASSNTFLEAGLKKVSAAQVRMRRISD
jgi:hypothetical protein